MRAVQNILIGLMAWTSLPLHALDFSSAQVNQKVIYWTADSNGRQSAIITEVIKGSWLPYRSNSITIRTERGVAITVSEDQLRYVWEASGCAVTGKCVGERTMLVHANLFSFGNVYEFNLIARGENRNEFAEF